MLISLYFFFFRQFWITAYLSSNEITEIVKFIDHLAFFASAKWLVDSLYSEFGLYITCDNTFVITDVNATISLSVEILIIHSRPQSI